LNSGTAVELDDSVPHWIAVSQITQTAPRAVIYDRPGLHKLGGIFAADLNEAVEHLSVVGGILRCMVTHFVELHEAIALFILESRRKLRFVSVARFVLD